MGRLLSLSNNKTIIMVMSKPKCGKTIFASQFPNNHYIDLDKGLQSVRAMTKNQGSEIDFPVYQIDSNETTDPDVIELLGPTYNKQSAWVKIKKLTQILGTKLDNQSFITIDPFTRLGEYLVAHIKKTTGHQQLQIQDWGTFVDEMCDFFEMLRAASFKANVILLAHENPVKDEMTGILERQVLMPTSAKFRAPGVVDEFYYLKTVSKVEGASKVRKIILQTVPDAAVATGSRATVPDMEQPTYEKLRPYLESALGYALPAPAWTPKENNNKKP